jgi:hypothetical protein
MIDSIWKSNDKIVINFKNRNYLSIILLNFNYFLAMVAIFKAFRTIGKDLFPWNSNIGLMN